MTKLNKKSTPNNIQTYTPEFQSIEEMFDYIDNWIPRNYTASVLAILREDDQVDAAYIRQVKKERIHNSAIINAMFRIAQFNARQLQQQ